LMVSHPSILIRSNDLSQGVRDTIRPRPSSASAEHDYFFLVSTEYATTTLPSMHTSPAAIHYLLGQIVIQVPMHPWPMIGVAAALLLFASLLLEEWQAGLSGLCRIFFDDTRLWKTTLAYGGCKSNNGIGNNTRRNGTCILPRPQQSCSLITKTSIQLFSICGGDETSRSPKSISFRNHYYLSSLKHDTSSVSLEHSRDACCMPHVTPRGFFRVEAFIALVTPCHKCGVSR
jgi:hypothetical protein